MSIPEYDEWLADPTPERMAGVVRALDPAITAEVQNYAGPKPLLRGKAKALAIKAVRTYDPTRGAQLRSWVVTQMRPLSRYTQQLRPVHAPEVAIRQAAEVNRVSTEMSDELGYDPSLEELADRTGISIKRIQRIRHQVKPAISESAFTPTAEGQSTLPGTTEPDLLGPAEDAVYESLSTRDKTIYDLKTGKHGKVAIPNMEIAKRLGVTPALISQRSQQIALQIQDVHQRGLV